LKGSFSWGIENWDDKEWGRDEKKWRNRRDFSFIHLCLVGGRKSGGIENIICINLVPWPIT